LRRLERKHGTTAGYDEHGLRPILLPINPLHIRRYTPKQFIGFFTADISDRNVNKIFTSDFGLLREELRSGQCSNNKYKRYASINKFIFLTSIADQNGGGH